MAFSRREHAGGAVRTTLASDISSGADAATLASGTGWPTGSTGRFWAVIDPDEVNEEKILITARSGAALTGITRGQDGTSAAAHVAGATVIHIFSAEEADEANQAVRATLGAVTTKGDLLAATGNQALSRLAAGTNGLPLVANSAQSTGLNYAALAATGLASNAVTEAKILDGSVTTTKVGNLAITTLKLDDDAVTGEKIADGAVDTEHIAEDAVEETHIADDAVGTGQIVDEAVTVDKFASGLRPTFIVADSSELGGLSPSAGDTAYQADSKYFLQYTGSAWRGIADLSLGRGRTLTRTYVSSPTGNEDANSDSPTYATWPSSNTRNVAVPAWATKARIVCTIGDITGETATTNHIVRTALGSLTGSHRRVRRATTAPASEITVGAVELDVSSVAGTTVALKTEATRVSGSGALRANEETVSLVTITYFEA